MCTVTYIPLGKSDFILTSSRDIPFARKKASHPQKTQEDGVELCYPKDGKAGGTWIGVSSKKRLICLLNGGYVYHTSRINYTKSRGLIVKELLKVDAIKEKLESISLIGVEQFTLTIVDWNDSLELIEFVWDGINKHLKVLPQEASIWSSSTLYDSGVKQLRKDWFESWQHTHGNSQKSMLDFHHTAGIGDPNIDVLMDRGIGGTVSITSVKKEGSLVSMDYEDVITKEKTSINV